MFEGLATEIDHLDIVPTRDAIIELAQLHQRLKVKLAQAVHAFSTGGSWGLDGAVSAKGWMQAHAGFAPAAAANVIKTGRTLDRLPLTTDAALNGTLSSDQLDAILSVIGNSQIEKFAEAESTMIPLLTPLDARRAAIAMRHWKATVTADDEIEPDVPAEGLHLNNLPDGSYLLNGTLGEDSGNTISEAIRVATTDDVPGEPERSRRSGGPMRCTTSASSSSTTRRRPGRWPTDQGWSSSPTSKYSSALRLSSRPRLPVPTAGVRSASARSTTWSSGPTTD